MRHLHSQCRVDDNFLLGEQVGNVAGRPRELGCGCAEGSWVNRLRGLLRCQHLGNIRSTEEPDTEHDCQHRSELCEVYLLDCIGGELSDPHASLVRVELSERLVGWIANDAPSVPLERVTTVLDGNGTSHLGRLYHFTFAPTACKDRYQSEMLIMNRA